MVGCLRYEMHLFLMAALTPILFRSFVWQGSSCETITTVVIRGSRWCVGPTFCLRNEPFGVRATAVGARLASTYHWINHYTVGSLRKTWIERSVRFPTILLYWKRNRWRFSCFRPFLFVFPQGQSLDPGGRAAALELEEPRRRLCCQGKRGLLILAFHPQMHSHFSVSARAAWLVCVSAKRRGKQDDSRSLPSHSCVVKSVHHVFRIFHVRVS